MELRDTPRCASARSGGCGAARLDADNKDFANLMFQFVEPLAAGYAISSALLSDAMQLDVASSTPA